MKYISITAILVIVSWGCSSVQPFYSFDETQKLIEQNFNDPLFAHAHWGVYIESLTTGKIWYERNSDKMFMPASNEKIPTAASALITLGPNFKYHTNLYYSGEIVDSILKGDLIVVGNGDPTFYTRFFNDPRDPFFNFADTIFQLGIKKIDGNIIGDDNAFDDNGYGYGWSHGGLGTWYSAESSALQFNENYIDLKIISPSSINDSVIIIPNVESNYYNIINNITVVDTGRTRLFIDRPFGSNEISISGNILVGSDTLERSPSIYNPTLFYTTVLKETLLRKGISVSGNAVDCDEIEDWNLGDRKHFLIVVQESVPLQDILKVLMKKSQNMYAETIVKTMGYEKNGVGSFSEGKKIVEDILSDFGIEAKTYAYMDGSGLSRYDFISPAQIVKILKGMRNSEFWDIWEENLPIAGVDGTLRGRMKGTKAEGNVRAKTGTISNVRGLSGYVTTAVGEEIVFSFLVNGHLVSSRATEQITDRVLALIAEYPYVAAEKSENK